MRLEGRIPRPQEEEAPPTTDVVVGRVFTVVGATAGTVAYNLAGLMARAAKGEGRRVLLVDAEGRVSQEVLPGVSR